MLGIAYIDIKMAETDYANGFYVVAMINRDPKGCLKKDRKTVVGERSDILRSAVAGSVCTIIICTCSNSLVYIYIYVLM
jgi:hypothetical protein